MARGAGPHRSLTLPRGSARRCPESALLAFAAVEDILRRRRRHVADRRHDRRPLGARRRRRGRRRRRTLRGWLREEAAPSTGGGAEAGIAGATGTSSPSSSEPKASATSASRAAAGSASRAAAGSASRAVASGASAPRSRQSRLPHDLRESPRLRLLRQQARERQRRCRRKRRGRRRRNGGLREVPCGANGSGVTLAARAPPGPASWASAAATAAASQPEPAPSPPAARAARRPATAACESAAISFCVSPLKTMAREGPCASAATESKVRMPASGERLRRKLQRRLLHPGLANLAEPFRHPRGQRRLVLLRGAHAEDEQLAKPKPRARRRQHGLAGLARQRPIAQQPRQPARTAASRRGPQVPSAAARPRR